MRKPALLAAVAAAIVAGPSRRRCASATTFNTGAQKPAEQQPADGVAVIYPVAYAGGDLDAARRRSPRTSTLATRGPGASTRSRPT